MELDAQTFRRISAIITAAEQQIGELLGKDVHVKVITTKGDTPEPACLPTHLHVVHNGKPASRKSGADRQTGPKRTLYDAQQPPPKLDRATRKPIVNHTWKLVSKCLSLDPQLVRSPLRDRDYADARHIISALVKAHYPEIPLAVVGGVLDRDRTTINNSIRVAEELLEGNPAFRAKYKACQQYFCYEFDIKEDRAEV